MKVKFLKALSILLALLMAFSVCSVVAVADTETLPSYYVMSGGTGDGRSSSNPAPTVAAAVASMNADGYDADDTVNIYLMQDAIGTATITDGYHNLPAWRDVAGGEAQPTYTAKIIVQPYNTSVRTYLAESTKYGENHPSVRLGGPTEFINIGVVNSRESYNEVMNINGQDFTWTDNNSHSYYYLGSNGGISGAWGLPIQTSFNGTFNNDFTVNVNAYVHYGTMYIGHKTTWGDVTYNGNVTFVLNNNGIGSHSNTPGAWVSIGVANTTFNKNLNIVVKDVSDVGFNAGSGTVSVAGGVQCVIAPGETVTHPITDLTCFAEGTKFWTLNPTTKAVMDLFTFTETAGTYAVAEGKELVATDEEGTQYFSKDGFLTIPVGTYSIDEYIPPVTKEFFVKNGGTGDGTTRENPAASVSAVIATIAAANLASRDTALITVLEREDWNAAPVDAVHNMTYMGNFSAATPQLVIQGDPESETKVHLAILDKISSRHVQFGDSVTFKNLVLVTTGAKSSQQYLDGNSVVYESDVEFAWAPNSWAGGTLSSSYADISANKYIVNANYQNKQTIEIKAPVKSGSISVPGNNYNSNSHTEDLTYIIDNPETTANVSFSGNHTNPFTTKFTKNVNINIKNATSINFKNGASANGKQFIDVAGGLQLILNSAVTYNTTDIGSIASITDTTPIYVIKNATGNADIINFTSKAGTYKVADGKTVYAVNDANNEEKYSEEGKLVLTAGNWTLYEYIPPKGVDYFVKYGGTGDGRTLENPAPSVYAVTAAIAQDLTAKDIAYVNIIAADDETAYDADNATHTMASWTGGTPTEHTAKMVVQGYNGTSPRLAFGPKYGHSTGGNVNIDIYGPTVIQSVKLVATSSYNRLIQARGYDLTIENNVGFYYCATWVDYTGSITNMYGSTVSVGKHSGSVETFKNAQTITYKAGSISSQDIYIPTSNYGASTHNEDVNIIVDNASIGNVNPLQFYFGSGHVNNVTTTFKKNLNINVKKATKVNFSNPAGKDGGYDTIKANAIQVILNPNVTYNRTDIANIPTIPSTTPVYILKDYTGVSDALSFTSEAGVYTVNVEGSDAVATAADGTKYQSDDGVLKIEKAGEYNITLIEEQTNDFDEYINKRGSNLQNTYKKLTEDNELKVVYFGGSVTNGYGGAGFDSNTLSWRAKIGNWLTSSFPNATITNVNKACGESGTFLGSYRLTRDILSEKPDLLFLEYSINDAYDFASYAKSSYQYETIVRQVKEELPDCEIVTILVTDQGRSAEAHKGNLHTQAQAHEDMAQIYNIPTLHVGRRLADELKGGWSSEVSVDNVHLTAYGNQLYYDVIHEYFANELIHGTYDGTMADDYVMPELQNEYLLDGNITYIEPSQALVDRSEELGGTGITYAHAPEFTTPGYDEIFNIRYNNNSEKILAIEFEGTELIGLFHNYSSSETFQISIDGGEYETKNFYHMNPTTFVTGLDSGKHIARIKFTVSESRAWLWLGALFSRDAEKRTAKQYAIDVEGGNAYTVLSGENVATTAGTEVNVTLKADVPAGYAFTGWEVVSGEVALADATKETTTFKMTTAPVEVKANYELAVLPDDGFTDVRDLVRLKKHLAGIITLGDYADYNKDGVIDAADLVTLRKIIIGEIEAPTSAALVITEGEVEVNEVIDIAGTDATDAVTATGENTIVNITGGTYDAADKDTAVWANGGATVNIYDGTFVCDGRNKPATSASHQDMIYAGSSSAGAGTINIYGGYFVARSEGAWLLNENDATGKITVYGGTFVNWNPANNVSEGANTNFVADGYTVVEETQANGDVWYTVVAE